jgi:basic membrane protein A
MDGFWDGVRYYDAQHHAHVKVLGWNEKTQRGTFLGSFFNTAPAAKLTRTFIKEGASTIFANAGEADLGTARAVRQADSAATKVSIEWSDDDGCVTETIFCRYTLTSVTKAIAPEVEAIALAAAHRHFPAEYVGTLANGGVALAPFRHFAHLIPAALMKAVKAVQAKIESGKIVPATKSSF